MTEHAPRQSSPKEAGATRAAASTVTETPLLEHARPQSAVSMMLGLQQTHGNRFVGRLIAGTPGLLSRSVESLIAREVTDEGKTGAEGVGETVPIPAQSAAVNMPPQNQDGFYDGPVTSNVAPHVFVNKGKTGKAMIHWVGGTGGLGNQAVGSIDVTAPVIATAEPDARHPTGRAWVKWKTGKLKATRSFTGAPWGANGPTAYMTLAGSFRVDKHERLHVKATGKAHKTHIKPLEKRVSKHKGKLWAIKSGASGAEASAALTNFLDWNTAVAAFAAEDTTENTPMGNVDNLDLNSGTYIQDKGAKKVRGVDYAHYYDTP